MPPPPKRGSKCHFHAGFSHKSPPEIALNSCSCQVYPITQDARLIYHTITRLFKIKFPFSRFQYVQWRHHAFPLGVPIEAMFGRPKSLGLGYKVLSTLCKRPFLNLPTLDKIQSNFLSHDQTIGRGVLRGRNTEVCLFSRRNSEKMVHVLADFGHLILAGTEIIHFDRY